MNDLIRQAIAAEADERVDSGTVLAGLYNAKKRRKPLGLIVGVATLTAAAAAAAVIVPTTIKKTEAAPAVSVAPDAQNVLLLGTDDHDRADAIVLARFDADGSVSAVSLPRDIAVGDEKINGMYLKSPEKLIDAVEGLTVTKVDHYAAIRMSEFGKIAQAVGGVEVCLIAATHDQVTGARFPAGKQTLAGDQALAFLRQRFALPGGDLDRTRRHQAFLTGLAAKITKDNAPALAREISTTIKVDAGWDVLEFAERFQGPVEVSAATLPVGDPVEVGNGEGFVVAPGQAKQFIETQFSGNAPQGEGCVR
ncbi:LCP family protein [Lentzea sp. E54]|uniref:LCP family protein n=1 Tax=Lentzea xerophila TaxID=3435883 RepID=UPI003DA57643